MSQNFRLPEIVDIARRTGRVTVDALSEHFGVTVQTIRRDLTELAEAGRLTRVHGGAVPFSGTHNIDYVERQSLNGDAKAAIAARCAAAIPDNTSVFLNIGTSTEAVARALIGHRNLLVLTNNMNVAQIFAASDCQVIVTGGVLRRSDGGLIGTLTTEAIRQFKLDIAVIGCSALDAEGDLRDYDIHEVGVSQTIIRQSRRTFLVADHSKFRRTAPALIASLSEIDSFFTDRPMPPMLATRCAQWGTSVVAG